MMQQVSISFKLEYIVDILQTTTITECKSNPTPIRSTFQLSKIAETTFKDVKLYMSTIEEL